MLTCFIEGDLLLPSILIFILYFPSIIVKARDINHTYFAPKEKRKILYRNLIEETRDKTIIHSRFPKTPTKLEFEGEIFLFVVSIFSVARPSGTKKTKELLFLCNTWYCGTCMLCMNPPCIISGNQVEFNNEIYSLW